MWTHEGVNYWWLDGRLWSAHDRTDEERGIRRPWSEVERREIEREFLLLQAVIAAALLCDAVVLWLGFRGG